MWVAENIFGLSPDASTLEAEFEAAYDITDENGVVVSTVHDNWQVANSVFRCFLDAISGEVIMFEIQTDDYPGESIKESGFDRMFAENIYDNPDNIYVKAARSIVEKSCRTGEPYSTYRWTEYSSYGMRTITQRLMLTLPVLCRLTATSTWIRAAAIL